MDISQFDYVLPQSLIAQNPPERRTNSRLLVVGGDKQQYQDSVFSEIGRYLTTDDLLVVNNTRVIPARVIARKPSGGKVEIMLERVIDPQSVLVLLRSNKKILDGQELWVGEVRLVVKSRQGQFFTLQLPAKIDPLSFFEDQGSIPLPPYITRLPEEADLERYQTVYATTPGAVAAPTAGLHFDDDLIDRLTRSGIHWGSVTLHVGAGTFQPVRCEDVRTHRMHHEKFRVSDEICQQISDTRARGGRVIAVGTTVVRALESAAQTGNLAPGSSDTDLFILPGYRFNVVDALITNFHLPKSTLLMMVSAFAGYQRIMSAYQYAIDQGYRFFSYGDAMFLEKQL